MPRLFCEKLSVSNANAIVPAVNPKAVKSMKISAMKVVKFKVGSKLKVGKLYYGFY